MGSLDEKGKKSYLEDAQCSPRGMKITYIIKNSRENEERERDLFEGISFTVVLSSFMFVRL